MNQKHDPRCETARNRKCTCSCGGQYHCTQGCELTKESKPSFKIGEIVRVLTRDERKHKPKREGLYFVQEIVSTPNHFLYSMFHTDPHVDDFFIGDHVLPELKATGGFMTREQLEDYKYYMPTGHQKDIQHTLDNLNTVYVGAAKEESMVEKLQKQKQK